MNKKKCLKQGYYESHIGFELESSSNPVDLCKHSETVALTSNAARAGAKRQFLGGGVV